jgi:transcriptional regulator with XRE-family HTH domain
MGRLPSGRQIRAARILCGLEQAELARLARIDASTLSRMENSGAEPARGHVGNLQRVVDALEQKGIELTQDGGVRPVQKVRR